MKSVARFFVLTCILAVALPGMAFAVDQSCRSFDDTFLKIQGLGSYARPNGYVMESAYDGDGYNSADRSRPFFNITSKSGHQFIGQAGTDAKYGNIYRVTIYAPAPKGKRESGPMLVDYVFQMEAGKCVLREIRDYTISKGAKAESFSKKDCDIANVTEERKSWFARICKPDYLRFFADDSADALRAPSVAETPAAQGQSLK
jgi:hypothetical protein